uniref:Copper acquisition factor BIM1-like domain-containing protein n=1 Tax=Mycena chlorophos TaxID=658473 RepID=A0ABQ0M6V1_MYCCL|nr:predicted protein [Mycena chlorophos]
MLSSSLLVVASLLASASAHFQMQYPAPWGVFVEDNEPTFCDGYNGPSQPPTFFPLSGGVISLNSEHTNWVVAISITSKTDPTQFSDFAPVTNVLSTDPTQFSDFAPVTNVLSATGEGLFCLPFDLSKTNATGFVDGMNATIQVEFNGGDGNLFQCAEVTLTKEVAQPGCSNGTGVASASLTPTPTASVPKPSNTGSAESGSGASSGASSGTTSASGSEQTTSKSAGVRLQNGGIAAAFMGVLGLVALAL